MNRALQEKRTLVEMARRFGQEPAPHLLAEIAELEVEEQQRQQRDAELRQRIAGDLNEIFAKAQTPELVQSVPEPSTPATGSMILTETQADQQLKITLPTSTVDAVDEYLRRNVRESTVVNPEPVLAQPGRNLEAEVKRLEQWVSRIAATGPGSGEVWFKFLNDVNRDTMTPGNDNWVLEYDVATKKVQFTKNVGPLETLMFNTSGSVQAVVPGQLHWNPAEDCLDIHQYDNTTLQVGLENYITVYNDTTSTLTNGTVVRFGGIASDQETPTATPHLADGTVPPLFTIGVLTTDVPPGSRGRATILGKVRDLNTTGASAGETWQTGDLLWVSPTMPGYLTKVKPTAPSIVVSVAAVLKVNNTSGIILVRPTVFPRLRYGRFSNSTNITTSSINTGISVRFNTTQLANGFYVSSNSRIYATESGFYDFIFGAQILSTNASAKNIWIWSRKNGNIDSEARRQGIVGNSVYATLAQNFTISMNAGDYVEIRYAVDDVSVEFEAAAATAFAPISPSVTLTVAEIAL